MPRSRAPCRSRLRHSSTAPFPGELFGTKSRQERPGKPYSLHPPSLFTLLFHSPFHTRQGTKYGFATRSFDDCGPACAPALLTEQRVRAWAWGLQRGVPRSREGQEGRPQRGRGWHRGTCSGTRAPRGGRRSHCVQGPCKPTPVRSPVLRVGHKTYAVLPDGSRFPTSSGQTLALRASPTPHGRRPDACLQGKPLHTGERACLSQGSVPVPCRAGNRLACAWLNTTVGLPRTGFRAVSNCL